VARKRFFDADFAECRGLAMDTDVHNQQAVTVSPLTSGNGNGAILHAQDIYRNDPLMILLREKVILNNLQLLICMVILSFIYFCGLYILPDTGHGLVNQPLFALLETITATFFFVAYLWIPDSVILLFNTLRANGVLDQAVNGEGTSEAYAKLLKDLSFWMSRVWWPIAALVFVAIYLGTRYVTKGPPFLDYVPSWLQIVTALLDVVIAYIALMGIVRILITLAFTNKLFLSFTLRVRPLHPDGAGGLGTMWGIVWLSALVMLGTTLLFFITIQLTINSSTLASTLDSIMLIALYVILTPLLILGWFILPHSLMLGARDKVLRLLADDFRRAIEGMQSLDGKGAKEILEENERFAAIKSRYDLLRDNFPTWPMEIGQVRRLVATLTLPALISLVPYIVSVVNFITQIASK
jgi:hypothetical protein